jgi:hypothetical protein
LDESKADKSTLEPILGCFHGLNESQRLSTYPGLFSQPNESKRAKKMLELVIPKPFQAWMRVKRISQHSNLSWVVFTAWMRAKGTRPILSCFSQLDESKRAKKMLELAIPKPF